MTSEAIDLVQAEQRDFLGIHGPRDFGMGKDPIHSTGLCSFVCGKRSNKTIDGHGRQRGKRSQYSRKMDPPNKTHGQIRAQSRRRAALLAHLQG